MTTITTNHPGLNYHSITVKPESVVTKDEDYRVGSYAYIALVVDGTAYPLARVAHADSNPAIVEAINAVLEQAEAAVAQLNAPATPSYAKVIQYDRETKDYAMYLDGELVGFARTQAEAENTLDALVFELLSAPAPVAEAVESRRETLAETADIEATTIPTPCPCCGRDLDGDTCPDGCPVRLYHLRNEAQALIGRLNSARLSEPNVQRRNRIWRVYDRARQREKRRDKAEWAAWVAQEAA